MTNFPDSLKIYQNRIDQLLQQQLRPQSSQSHNLFEAMHYTVLNGGKRLRPLLTYTTGEMLGITPTHLDAAACAIELIHAYSLVHDDLPAMDNDDFRRGKPTCHKAYDEATAILVGDALQTLAFQILSEQDLAPIKSLKMVQILAKAAGCNGMAGGQAMDLSTSADRHKIEHITQLYHQKTGALIAASIEFAIIAADNLEPTTQQALKKLSQNFGLAFQIQDDILDIEGDLSTLGKTPLKDQKAGKATYAAVAGVDISKDYVKQLREEALEGLDFWGNNSDKLRDLIKYVLYL
jgi:farnesyl diphosphate synthase